MGGQKDCKYTVYPTNDGDEFVVYCDLTTNGGGWTVIQRRHDLKVSFARNSEHYREGFGEIDGEFWLGNEKIHRLGQGQLLFKLLNENLDWTYDLYNNVFLDDSSTDFTLTAKDHSGFMIPNGILGTSETAISFHDRTSLPNCMGDRDGGWWIDSQCTQTNLNSEMGGCQKPFPHSEMLMRPQRRCEYHTRF